MFVVKCTITRLFTLVNNFLTKNIKFFIYFEKMHKKAGIISLPDRFSLCKHPLHNLHNIFAPEHHIMNTFAFMVLMLHALCHQEIPELAVGLY